MYIGLIYEARTYRRKVFAGSSKKGFIEGASTCNMKLGGHDVLDKKTKVKSAPLLITLKVFLIVFTLVFGDLPRLYRLKVIGTLSLLLIIYLGIVGYIR